MKWEPLESWNEWDDCHCTGIKNDRISCSTACGTAHIRLHIREADMSLWCLQENKSLLGHEKKKKKKKNLTKRSMTHRWPLTHFCWGHMCDSTQGSLYPSPMKICQSMWIQWPFFKILEQRSLTPGWPLTPSLLRSYVTLPKDHWVQVPWKYIKVCGYSDPFFKTLNQRSLTSGWPLTPYLLRSHVWL